MRARDEIPKLLMGRQHIYYDQELREKVFAILKKAKPVFPRNWDCGYVFWRTND
jgi:hypothetical protein